MRLLRFTARKKQSARSASEHFLYAEVETEEYRRIHFQQVSLQKSAGQQVIG